MCVIIVLAPNAYFCLLGYPGRGAVFALVVLGFQLLLVARVAWQILALFRWKRRLAAQHRRVRALLEAQRWEEAAQEMVRWRAMLDRGP